MSVSKRVRFDVFKRDDFTCQYCGRKTPEVVLEIDHIIPRVEDGDDTIENLITACFDCNRGKGKELLQTRTDFGDLAGRAELIREREEQLRAYHTARNEVAERRRDQFDEVHDYWFFIWDETEIERYYLINDSTLRRYIDALGVEEVKDAMDIARGRFRYLNTIPVRYCVGVLKRKLADIEAQDG